MVFSSASSPPEPSDSGMTQKHNGGQALHSVKIQVLRVIVDIFDAASNT